MSQGRCEPARITGDQDLAQIRDDTADAAGIVSQSHSKRQGTEALG
jgi:hypothetical protein